MAQQIIDIGVKPADGSGDPLRVCFDKINQNFTEVYSSISAAQTGGGSGVTSVAGKTGQVQLSTADVIGAVSQGYVDNRVQFEIQQQIAAVVAAAPLTLNTLEKLAHAVGDNPDFAAEVFSQIAAKRSTTQVTPPQTAVGSALDKAGMFAITATHIYYCTADYNGSDVWTRTPLNNTWA
jgi:hypothetical protein